ncbi:MAG: LuxR family transcriptional regulator [Verrucomicrobia bacterium]|nr:LuxR family transcriptional regulator [Verrucomicrobiota bacterium]
MIAAQPLDQIQMVSLSTRRPFPRRLFNVLSRLECLAVLEIIHLATHADRAEHVRSLLVRFQDCFSFTRALGGLIRLGPGRTFSGFARVINAGYPDDRRTPYREGDLAELDPLLTSTLKSLRAYHWREIRHTRSSEQERDFIAAARHSGLHNGMTIGWLDRTDTFVAFCSFAGDRDLDAERVVPLVQYVGAYILQALRRMTPPIDPAVHHSIQDLSSREKTILMWVKIGKTNWEIGRILGVSERTIRFHIGRIFSKLDVISRSQAVAVAVEQGLADLAGPIGP